MVFNGIDLQLSKMILHGKINKYRITKYGRSVFLILIHTGKLNSQRKLMPTNAF